MVPYGVTRVGLSRLQRDGLFGFLTLAMGAALVRGLIGAGSTSGRLLVGVIFGGALLLVTAGWLRVVRRAEHLDISDTEVRLVSGDGSRPRVIQRASGEQLRFVARSAGRVTLFGLYQPGSDTTLLLQLFSRKAVEAALLAHGWQLGSPAG